MTSRLARALDLTRRLLDLPELTARERKELSARRERLERRAKGAERRLHGVE